MPHIIVKLYPGRSEQQKTRLAEQIVKDVVATLGSDEDSVSVALAEVKPEDWAETVYRPEIADHWDKLYKKPGYNPLRVPNKTTRKRNSSTGRPSTGWKRSAPNNHPEGMRP